MAITRIQNNQITDSSAGNVYLGVNAAAKVQDYSITAGKIQNNLTYGSDLTITGNLTVQGNTTTIDTVNLTVEDPLILLAKEQTGSPTLDIGYIGKRGTEDNIAFVWDESADEFVTVFTTSENTNTVITISSYASFRANSITANANLTVAGVSDFNGNVAMGNIQFDSGANINVGNNRIQNVAEPSANTDAATKQYVDSVSSSGFTIEDDAANTTTVSGGDTLELLGTANQVSVLITGDDQVTFALTSNVSVAGNVTGGNLVTGGVVSSTGNVIGGNLVTGGLASVTGNVTGGNLLTGGIASVAGTATAGNVATGGTVSATGNITGGNILTAGVVSATGNVTGNYILGNGAFLSGIDAAQIRNGTSNVQIPVANGNIEMTVNGTADVVVINQNGGDVVGYWSATGNVTGGNVLTGGQVSATGNATAANMLTGGTVSATGNVTGGNVVTGGLVSATGNATAANMLTGGVVSATGNVTGGNLVTAGLATVTGNVIGGNISTAGQVTATGNVTGANVNAGIVSATGNIFGNNITSYGFVSAVGNVVAAAVTTALVANSGAITIQSGGAGDLILDSAGNIDADSNYINNVGYPVQDADAATKLYVDNMVSSGLTYHQAVVAATTANLATTTGGTITYNQPNGAGNGIGATITTTGSFNLIDTANVQTANTRILVKDEGNAALNGIYVWSNATVITRSTDADEYGPNSVDQISYNDYFFVSSGNVNKGSAWVVDEPQGNITFGTSNIAFAQFSSSQTYTANTQAGLVLNGTVFSAKVDNDTTAFDGGGNIIVKASANLVTPNIGAATGSSLSLTGNVVSGNVNTGIMSASGNVTGSNILTTGIVSATGNITGNYFFGNGSQLTGVTASAVDANNLIGNTLSANVLFSSLTTVGNLISLNVDGTTTTGNLATGGTVSATGNVTGGNMLTGGVVSATGNVTGGNVVTGGLVSATGNVTGGNLVTSGIATITGTVTAGNVATGGTVSATGNVTGGNLLTGGVISATGNLNAGNVTTGIVSATGNINGTGAVFSGNVSAANFIGNISGNIDAAGANTEVQFNNNDLLGASSNFTFNTATNILTVTGTIQGTTVSATGNVIGGNVSTAGLVTATGNVTGGNVSTAGLVTATGNVTGGNVFTGGVVSATGNITGANVILTSGTVDGPAAGIIAVNGSGLDTDFSVSGDTVANILYIDAGLGTTSFGNSGAITNAIASFNTTDSILLPRGNTAQRPAPATVGMFRFNTTSDALEVYNSGTGWTTVEQDFTVIVADSFTGNGSQTIFTLSEDSTTAGTIVSINGVVQIPTTAYSVSGNALTFTEAPGPSDTIDARILTTSTTVASLSNASGNATVNCLDAADTVEIEGNLLPSANITYNLGSPTKMWKNGYFAGNTIFLGNLQLKQADANTFAVYTSDGVTQANIDVGSVDVSSIISGTSVIGIGAPNGNAYLAPAGSNTLVAASTGVFVTGVVSASGNVTGNYILGNGSQLSGIITSVANINNGTSIMQVVSSGGAITANVGGVGNVMVLSSTGMAITGDLSVTGNATLSGNILGDRVQNGTTSLDIQTQNGNANISVGGTSNVAVFATTGLFVTGLASVTGNVIGGNVTTAGLISATGNITGGNILGGANVNATTHTGTTVSVTGNIDAGNLRTGGLVSATGNVIGGNVTTAGLISATGNITGGNLITGAGSGGNITGANVVSANTFSASSTVSATGNVTGGNILTAGLMSATGNVTGGNILTAGVVSATGNITGNFILGNGSQLSGIITSVANINNGTSNVTVVSSGGNITAGIGGTGNVLVLASTGAFITGLASVTGNVTAGNLITGAGSGGNITGANVISATTISASGNVDAGNLNVTGNIVDTGALSIITGSNGNITLSPNGTGVIIANKDLLNGQANGVGNIGNSTGYFNTIFAKATSAQYADLAEMYEADGPIEPGTVVAFGGTREVTACDESGSRRVAGVVSTNPSYIMNAGLAGDTVVAVALTGRVPTKVTGTVRKGDLMVAAGAGRARAEANPQVGAVIGKALADFDGAEGTIEVVVGRL